MKNNRGFTLIELLTVLSILGILAFAALPSFAQFIKQDRIVSTTNSLMSTFKMARSEAIKRERIVTLTANNNTWSASVDNEVFVVFDHVESGVQLDGLNTQTITAMGESPVTNILISDGDDSTTDRCFRIFLSGQSKVEKGAC